MEWGGTQFEKTKEKRIKIFLIPFCLSEYFFAQFLAQISEFFYIHLFCFLICFSNHLLSVNCYGDSFAEACLMGSDSCLVDDCLWLSDSLVLADA